MSESKLYTLQFRLNSLFNGSIKRQNMLQTLIGVLTECQGSSYNCHYSVVKIGIVGLFGNNLDLLDLSFFASMLWFCDALPFQNEGKSAFFVIAALEWGEHFFDGITCWVCASFNWQVSRAHGKVAFYLFNPCQGTTSRSTILWPDTNIICVWNSNTQWTCSTSRRLKSQNQTLIFLGPWRKVDNPHRRGSESNFTFNAWCFLWSPSPRDMALTVAGPIKQPGIP